VAGWHGGHADEQAKVQSTHPILRNEDMKHPALMGCLLTLAVSILLPALGVLARLVTWMRLGDLEAFCGGPVAMGWFEYAVLGWVAFMAFCAGILVYFVACLLWAALARLPWLGELEAIVPSVTAFAVLAFVIGLVELHLQIPRPVEPASLPNHLQWSPIFGALAWTACEIGLLGAAAWLAGDLVSTARQTRDADGVPPP